MSIKDPKGVGDFVKICILIFLVGIVISML